MTTYNGALKVCSGARGFSGRECGALFTHDGRGYGYHCGPCRQAIRRNNHRDGTRPGAIAALYPVVHRYTSIGECVEQRLDREGNVSILFTRTYASGQPLRL